MICQKCGAEIPENCLICEACGMEIQMVPDFEPEVEDSISETLLNVAEMVTTSNESAEEDEKYTDGFEKQKNYFVLSLGCVFVFALIVITTVLSIKTYQKSAGYFMKQSEEMLEESDYENSLIQLQAALNAGGNYEEIKFKMARCYQQLGKDEEYANLLVELIKYEDISEEGLHNAFAYAVSFYANKGQYELLNSLLQSCENTSIKEKYTQYMADMPQFNYTEGSYNEIIPLKILSNTSGTIYYTMDGSEPTRYSAEYISPIFLETGDYVITAMFVNEYGIKSPLSKVTYHVDVSVPFAPEVNAYSGDFNKPQLIEITAEEDCEIYYTTDGTDPDSHSTLYNGFLPMPLGKSSFKFVAIDENNVSSEIIVRNYNLALDTQYSVSQAQAIIPLFLFENGLIMSLDGTISNEDIRKLVYVFACCTSITDESDYYIFSEYILNPDATTIKTGNYYAVDAYDLSLYGTQYNAGTGTFALSTQRLK